MLLCRSAAKVNLTLDVLARRDDGYHELHSVVHTVGLWDELGFEFETPDGALRLECDQPDLANDSNLCLKAARAWLRAAAAAGGLAGDDGTPAWRGLRITLRKHIPAGAGLGGGSGNAAATLLALGRHFDPHGRRLEAVALRRLAAGLGADVPLFLRGGCAVLEGVGERFTPLPALAGWLVIAQPPRGLATARVFRQWDEMGLASARATPACRAALERLAAGREAVPEVAPLAKLLHNDLQGAARVLGADSTALIEALIRHGALGAAMTGSGAAVFGIFEDETAARRAARRLAGELAGGQVWAAAFRARGVEFDGA